MVNTLLNDGTTILPNNVVKHLGIFIVKFYNHSSTVMKKANSMYMDHDTCVIL